MEEDKSETTTNERSLPTITALNKMIKFILKRWLLFLIVGILGGLAGVIYASNEMPTYKSSLTFALDDGATGSGVGNLMNLASQFGFNIASGGKDVFSGDNILEIMRSRRMIERVLLSIDTFSNKSYTLIEYYLEKAGKRKSNPKTRNIHFPIDQPRNAFSYQQDSLLYKIYKEFSEKYIVADRPDRKIGIYEVNFTSIDEKFTKDFTDRIVAETNNFYVEIRTKKAKETLNILEQRVANMKGNLNSSITNKASIQDVNINPVFSEAQVPVQKQQANIQVYGAAYGEMFKNLELARFQYLNEIPLMQIIDHADYPMEKMKMGKMNTGILFAIFSGLFTLLILGFINIFSIKKINKL